MTLPVFVALVATVVIVKVAVFAPAGTVTVAGAVAAVLVLVMLTVVATIVFPVKVTVPVTFPPPTSVAGDRDKTEISGGRTVRVVVFVTPP